jgi:NAD(P)-dependent dehydrogenase (short-subunit alcohol dehydrogenase family)
LDVDLTATVLVARAALDLLCAAGSEHGQALLVNLASISGKRADPGFSVYCAAKFGVVGFTAALNRELSDDGVGACAVCPGLVNTDMGSWAHGWAAPSKMLQPDHVAAAVRENLLGRAAAQVPAELLVEAPPWQS